MLFLFGLAGELLMNDSGHWGVLEALATAGAFSLPFLFLKPNWRLAFAAVFLIGYQAAVLIWKIPLISYFEESGLAGPFASFAWGFIVLAGSFVSELFLKDGKGPKRNKLIPFGLAAGVAGVLLGIWLPFNKHEASVSYILLTTGACCILAWLLTFYQSIEEHSTSSVQDRAGWVLVILGKNSLILYMLSSVIILPENALIQTTSPLWLVFTGTLAVLAVVYAVGWFLQRFKIIIKL